MTCSNCLTENGPNAKFCMSCGEKLERRCRHCGTEYAEDARFCMECGESLGENQTQTALLEEKKEAERRQLTVMFCGIIDSAEKSNEMGVEAFRKLLLDYQSVAKKVVTHYGGHIAQFLNDGMLVYFGYPKGLEDAPRAGVRCGLGIMEALTHARAVAKEAGELFFDLRIGIHTGQVVVDNHLALGNTTNIAARIERMATANMVLVSEATYTLVEGWFEAYSLGSQKLKGISKPMEVFRAINSSGARSRLEIAISKGLSPLVGRDAEIQLLRNTWEKVYEGSGQIMLLSGEAGIGKSRLVQFVKSEITVEPNSWMLEAHCSAYHKNTAFYPIIDLMEGGVLNFEMDDSIETKQNKLEGYLLEAGANLHDVTPILSELLSLPLQDKYTPSNLSAAGKKQKIRNTLLGLLVNRSRKQPVLLVIEDLHWADPSTLEWIDIFIDQLTRYPIFVLCTTRPEYQPEWLGRSHASQLKIRRLSEGRIEAICQHYTKGKKLPEEVLQQIRDKTNGIPLFVEELSRMIIHSEILAEKEDHYELKGPLSELAIPSTLQDSLIARLDGLGETKELAQIGSIIGREFSYAVLRSVSGQTEQNLKQALESLVDGELLYQQGVYPDASFIFKHALIQDTAYGSLLKTKRQYLHQRVAQVLEEEFGHLVSSKPEILAHHFTEAKNIDKALDKWQTAGQLAILRHAFREGIHHLKRGIALLPHLENEGERLEKELAILKVLTPSLQLSKGYANEEAESMANRWLEVANLTGTTEKIYDAMVAQFTYYTFSANYSKGESASNELLKLSKKRSDQYYRAVGLFFSGINKTLFGKYDAAKAAFTEALTLYKPNMHLHRSYYNIGNLKSTILTYYTTSLHVLGYPDQALENAKEGRRLAFEVNQPGSIYSSTAFIGRLFIARKEYEAVPEVVLPILKTASDNGDPFVVAVLSYYNELSKAYLGDEAAADKAWFIINKLYRVYKSYRVAFLTYIADAYGKLGKPDKGLNVIDAGLKHIQDTGEKLYQPELFRVEGELILLKRNDEEQAEASFEKALQIAREQHDVWHEMLIAKSLAQLYKQQNRVREAYEALAPVIEAFPEKSNLIDLREAEELLNELKTQD